MHHEVFVHITMATDGISGFVLDIPIVCRPDGKYEATKEDFAVRRKFLLEYHFECTTLKQILDFSLLGGGHLGRIRSDHHG